MPVLDVSTLSPGSFSFSDTDELQKQQLLITFVFFSQTHSSWSFRVVIGSVNAVTEVFVVTESRKPEPAYSIDVSGQYSTVGLLFLHSSVQPATSGGEVQVECTLLTSSGEI